jgi:hypothetical protein
MIDYAPGTIDMIHHEFHDRSVVKSEPRSNGLSDVSIALPHFSFDGASWRWKSWHIRNLMRCDQIAQRDDSLDDGLFLAM